MATIKHPDAISIARKMMEQLKEGVRQKLSKYCVNRAIQLGLISKSFPHEFSMGRSVVETRKTVSKFKTMFLKYVLKTTPIVTFAQREYMEILNRDSLILNFGISESRESLQTNVNWEQLGYTTPNITHYRMAGSTNLRQDFLRGVPELRWMYRYTRYLNYLFRKYGIPIEASVNNEMNFDDAIYSETRGLTSSQCSIKVIPYQITSSIVFKFVKWYFQSNDERTKYYEDVINRVIEDDSVYSSDNEWERSSNVVVQIRNRSNSSSYRFSMEKIFLHMEKGLVMLNTLTRKVKYGSNAYNFRIKETT